MNVKQLRVALALVAMGACVGRVGAEEASAVIPAEVMGHMKAMGRALRDAESYRFTAEGDMDEALESGQLVRINRLSRMAVKRPDRLHLDIDGDDANWEMWYDGKQLTVLDRDDGEAAVVKAPATLDELVDTVIDEYGLTIPLSDLLYSDVKGTLLAHVQEARYLGIHAVGEHACHHLWFRQDVINWQLWIDSGEIPVPRKLVITYKTEPGMPQYVSRMSDWDLTPEFAEDTFTKELAPEVKRMSMADFLGIATEKEAGDEDQ